MKEFPSDSGSLFCFQKNIGSVWMNRYYAHQFLLGEMIIVDTEEKSYSFFTTNYKNQFNQLEADFKTVSPQKIGGLLRKIEKGNWDWENGRVIDSYIHQYLFTDEQRERAGHFSGSDMGKLIGSGNDLRKVQEEMCEFALKELGGSHVDKNDTYYVEKLDAIYGKEVEHDMVAPIRSESKYRIAPMWEEGRDIYYHYSDKERAGDNPLLKWVVMDRNYFIGTVQNKENFAIEVFEKEEEALAFLEELEQGLDVELYTARIERVGAMGEVAADLLVTDHARNKTFTLAIWNGDLDDPEDLYICPVEVEEVGSEDERTTVHMSDVLSPNAFALMKNLACEQFGSFEMDLMADDLDIDLAEIANAEYYAELYKEIGNDELTVETFKAYEEFTALGYPKIQKAEEQLKLRDNMVREQLSNLSSMHFWRMNIQYARRDNDQEQIDMSDDAIRFRMEVCDRLGVTYKLQNEALLTAENRKSFSSIEKGLKAELEKNYMIDKLLSDKKFEKEKPKKNMKEAFGR